MKDPDLFLEAVDKLSRHDWTEVHEAFYGDAVRAVRDRTDLATVFVKCRLWELESQPATGELVAVRDHATFAEVMAAVHNRTTDARE